MNQNQSVNFVVETFEVEDGYALKTVERDADGYFKGVPLAVLGDVTRNSTCYDIPSMVRQISTPGTAFNIRLTEGCLSGEWGHPVVDFSSAVGKQRILTIDPTKEAVHYRKIYTKTLRSSNKIAILGDIKPAGPYGEYLEERMIDPTRNCAFSLRSITSDRIDPRTKIIYKNVAQLVTFDAGVPSGGYKEASKRYMSGVESLGGYISYPVTMDEMVTLQRTASCESLKDDEICELFQANKVTINREVFGIIDLKSKIVYSSQSGTKRGMFSSFLSVK